MPAHEKVREFVSKSYAKAVTSPSHGSCCSGPDTKGTLAQMAGYSPEELSALPDEAVINSFGCGNPLAFSEVKEGDVVLDLGSGAGIDLLIAAQKVGPTGKVIGVDMTEEMIFKAQENIAAAGLANVEVRKGIIEELPVETSSVDWVISNCVINLSPEKNRVFAEIARVLKPGGQMRVSDIVVKALPEWARQKAALYASCVAGAIDELDYLDGIRTAGLEGVEVLERFVYDTEQLKGFLESDLTNADAGFADWVESEGEETLAQTAEVLCGKVWSAKIYARKPAE
jgi:ubiquinone/menaquinone biosynthesis C-methylase UbiE